MRVALDQFGQRSQTSAPETGRFAAELEPRYSCSISDRLQAPDQPIARRVLDVGDLLQLQFSELLVSAERDEELERLLRQISDADETRPGAAHEGERHNEEHDPQANPSF